MKQFIFLLLLLIACFGKNQAQSSQSTTGYAFKVVASKGDATVSRDGTNWKPVKAGSQLMKEDKIKLTGNSFLGLVHANGRTLELKLPGTYSVSELMTKITSANTSINQRYVNFVINEMTKEDTEDINKNRHRNMGVEGKVERGDGIQVLIPEDAYVLHKKASVRWYTIPGTKTYQVTIKDVFGEILFAATTPDTLIEVDFNNPKFKNEENQVTIQISSREKPAMRSSELAVHFPAANEAASIQKDLASLMAGAEDNSLNKLVQASFFEDNKLYLDAIQSYLQAIQMQPGVDNYKRVYYRFLQRYDLAKQQAAN